MLELTRNYLHTLQDIILRSKFQNSSLKMILFWLFQAIMFHVKLMGIRLNDSDK